MKYSFLLLVCKVRDLCRIAPIVFLALPISFLYVNNACAVVTKDAGFPIRVIARDFGIYKLIDRSDKKFIPDATAGYASVITTNLIKETYQIPLEKNIVFGFNYIIEDNSVDAPWIPVTVEIKHPVTTNYLGHQSHGFKKESAAKKGSDGRYQNGVFYVLSEDYEMVPGRWIISVTYRDKNVLMLDFIVR